MDAWIGDQRAAAWADSMSGGAAQESGELVPAGLAARGMSPSQSDDSMTHKCEGCQNGEPCSSCGGNISLGAPALQALDWGMAVASNSTFRQTTPQASACASRPAVARAPACQAANCHRHPRPHKWSLRATSQAVMDPVELPSQRCPRIESLYWFFC